MTVSNMPPYGGWSGQGATAAVSVTNRRLGFDPDEAGKRRTLEPDLEDGIRPAGGQLGADSSAAGTGEGEEDGHVRTAPASAAKSHRRRRADRRAARGTGRPAIDRRGSVRRRSSSSAMAVRVRCEDHEPRAPTPGPHPVPRQDPPCGADRRRHRAGLGLWRDMLASSSRRSWTSRTTACRSRSSRSAIEDRAGPAHRRHHRCGPIPRREGEGFHHVCFEVPNLTETLLRLEMDGLELIDTAPRRGAEGPVAFIHPRSCHGVLVELIEAPGGPAWTALGFV